MTMGKIYGHYCFHPKSCIMPIEYFLTYKFRGIPGRSTYQGNRVFTSIKDVKRTVKQIKARDLKVTGFQARLKFKVIIKL